MYNDVITSHTSTLGDNVKLRSDMIRNSYAAPRRPGPTVGGLKILPLFPFLFVNFFFCLFYVIHFLRFGFVKIFLMAIAGE